MLLNLSRKKLLVAGLNGTGKTYLAKKLSRSLKCLVITMTPQEWQNESVIIGACQNTDDYEFWIKNYKKVLDKINCIIFDDFDVLFNSYLQNIPELSELIFRNRHIGRSGLTILAVTRRPQNIPTKYYETFDTLILFSIESPNAIQKYNEYYKDLGEMVKQIPFGSYQFIIKEVGKNPEMSKVS